MIGVAKNCKKKLSYLFKDADYVGEQQKAFFEWYFHVHG